MKLFIDSANPTQIQEMWDLGIIDGVTTNPSLAASAGVDYKNAVESILNTVDGDISLEVLSLGAHEMVTEARKLAALHHNVVVKLPTTLDGLKALKTLSAESIRINMTLVFSTNQALLAAKAGAYIVSPFIGRLEDSGEDAINIIREIRQIYDNYNFQTQILFASVRSPAHVKEAALAGCEIATVPYAILQKLIQHPLTDVGLKKFLDDFTKSKQKPLV